MRSLVQFIPLQFDRTLNITGDKRKLINRLECDREWLVVWQVQHQALANMHVAQGRRVQYDQPVAAGLGQHGDRLALTHLKLSILHDAWRVWWRLIHGQLLSFRGLHSRVPAAELQEANPTYLVQTLTYLKPGCVVVVSCQP